MIGIDVENVGGDACRRGRFQHRDRQVAQPDDFLDQLAGGVVFAGQVALFVVEVLAGGSGCGFADALAEWVVAVADDLPCCCVGGGDSSSGCVIAVVEPAVTGQVACRVVAVAGVLCAALAL